MKLKPVDQIDLAFLREAFPSNSVAGLVPWIEPLRATCLEFGIGTVREVASFFANIAVESGDLRSQSESLNYSTEALLSKFSRERISKEAASRLGRQPGEAAVPVDRQRQIANLLYGGEWGKKNLGNRLPDDGWNLRGGGLIQLTGRANFEAFAKAVGIKFEDAPAYVRTVEGGCRSAGWFWKTRNMNKLAATPGFADDRKAINGGSHGLEEGTVGFNNLVQVLLRRGC